MTDITMRRAPRARLAALALAAAAALAAGRAAAAPVGTDHPASGPWAPVGEAGWAAATWSPGARYVAGEGSDLTVAVWSGDATRVVLEIYDQATGADAVRDYDLRQGPDGVWRGRLAQVPGKALYAFRAWGPNWPSDPAWKRGGSSAGFRADVDAKGRRFNPNKVLFDPYALELTHDVDSAALKAAGEDGGMFGTGGADADPREVYRGPVTGNVAVDRRTVDTGRYAPKGVALADASSYGTKPAFAMADERVYEAHVKGLTAHPSAARLSALLAGRGFPGAASVPDALRGTYAGAAALAPYLRQLGYTAIELLPVHETDNDTGPTDRPGGNYWGYDTYAFFAPDRHYAHDRSPGGPTREFKAMVKAFHDAGLEVWLDVVYNHTGEGQTWETKEATRIVSLRGFGNPDYYLLSFDPGWFWDTTCCGDVNAASAPGRRLIVDSLEHWARDMGVDGFRFDLAVVLGLEQRAFTAGAATLKAIADAARAGGYKVVAEPWDAQGNVQLGAFPPGWAQWNGNYRDAVRPWVKGDLSGSRGVGYADAFYGDFAHFQAAGGPQLSVNLLDAHDGFGLVDLVSYSVKTNALRAWPFGPSDGGSDDNRSSDWGGDHALRRQVIRTLLGFQVLSRGVPMQVWGDELGRTQNGNNNPYDVDSVATWNNYDMLAAAAPDAVPTGDATGGTEAYHDDLGTFGGGQNQNLAFLRQLLRLRNDHPAFRQASYAMPIAFAHADGSPGFDQHTDLLARILVSGSAVGDSDFVVLANASAAAGDFALPAPPAGQGWVRVVDTQAWFEGAGNAWLPCSGTAVTGSYRAVGRSVVVLQAVNTGACSCAAVPVTFGVAGAGVGPGEELHVSGDAAALGAWAPAGLALSRQGDGPGARWTGTAQLPPGAVVQYKYVKVDRATGAATWEGDQPTWPNRTVTVGPCGTRPNVMDGGWRE